MKFLIFLMTFTFISCATQKKMRVISETQYDGLKFESLKRFDYERLSKEAKLGNTLALCFAGRYKEAFDIYKKQLDQKTENSNYWNQVGTCYTVKKDYTQALSFFNLSLATAKTNTEKAIVLNNFGVIHLEQENYEEAKEYFKQSLKLAKNFLTPKYNLTQIYLKYGLYNKAKPILTDLLNKNQNDIDFLNSYAHLELMTKNYKNALVFFNKIPESYRYRDDIATTMAMTYYMLGLYQNSLESINKAPKKDKFYLSKQLEIKNKIESLDELNGK